MSGPPAVFEQAVGGTKINAQPNPSPHLASLLRRHVEFWSTAEDPWLVHVVSDVTEVQRVRNTTRDNRSLIDRDIGGAAWAYQDPGNLGSGVKKSIAGPFPMIIVPFADRDEDKAFIKTYEAWRAGHYSGGRAWTIDSAASASLRPATGSHLSCGYVRVVWELGASTGDRLDLTGLIEDCNLGDPPAGTTHRLTVYLTHALTTHYVVTFDPPGGHQVQARQEGEVAHVLGKAAVRRRY
ncbi:hypothetical protein JCM10296v2_003896 [Rhodotorula toruloides]